MRDEPHTSYPTAKKEWKHCPKCWYTFYKYYPDEVNPQEVPVVIRTPFGWLCRLCRYEWDENNKPVDGVTVEKHAQTLRTDEARIKDAKNMHEMFQENQTSPTTMIKEESG